MTPQTELFVDSSTIWVRQSGPAIAVIYIVTGEDTFPGVGWDDFAVVILGWWAGAFCRILRSESKNELVHFMDGPYAVEVSMPEPGMLNFRMIARDVEVGTGAAEAKLFVANVIAQSQKLLEECRSKGGWSSDANHLASELITLEREARLLL